MPRRIKGGRPKAPRKANPPRGRLSSGSLIVDKSSFGFVRADLQLNVHYANAAALRILGLSDYRGKRLDMFFADSESHKRLRSELQRRRKGLTGNYIVNVRRPDETVIPVEVTGVPVADGKGKVIGSLGLYRSLEREKLIDDIQEVNRGGESCNDLLVAVAERIKKVIPFHVMIVSRYSEGLRHSSSFFVYGLAGELQSRRRWIQLSEAQAAWIKQPGVQTVEDISALLEDPKFASMKEEALVKDLLSAGCRSALVRAAHKPNKIIGAFSLISRSPAAFKSEHAKILEQLPLDATMIHAIEYADSGRVEQRLELIRTLNGCTSIQTAAKKLAEQLVAMFGWSHVSVFRVVRSAEPGKIELVDQHSPKEDKLIMSKNYDQDITVGVLGRVVRDQKLENVPNVKNDPDYVPNPAWGDRINSELCCPISFEGEKITRWIVNVEDTRPSAFSSDECDELSSIAAELGSVMQRISQLYFLTQCFNHTSDPIFVTNAKLRITKANPAAARLLGQDKAKNVKGSLAALFKRGELEERMAKYPPPSALGELAITSAAGTEVESAIPVHLSCQEFPEQLGGFVFVARDMRQIRREVESQLFKKAAYEVAVEVSSPLSVAIAGVERAAQDEKHADALDRVRRQLYRVRRAYTKLAMFNPDARPTAANFTTIYVDAELDAILANLPEEEATLVQVSQADGLPAIKGDPFQITFTLETLLALLIRSAPENKPAQVEVVASNRHVELRLSGYLPDTSVDTTFSGSSARIQADLQIAEPLLRTFVVDNHGGALERNTLPDGRHQFVLRFPAVPS